VPGVLLTYGNDIFETGRLAARLGAEILKGANPAELPVETAESYLAVNLETAAAIGIEVPDTVLRQANTIYRQGE
jgi:putative ABC transport system substrate-binding protein